MRNNLANFKKYRHCMASIDYMCTNIAIDIAMAQQDIDNRMEFTDKEIEELETLRDLMEKVYLGVNFRKTIQSKRRQLEETK